MSFHFPKIPFSNIKSAFGMRSKGDAPPAPPPTSPRSRPGMAQDHMPPRRTASAPAGSAQFTDRRGATPGSRSGGSTHGAQARKPDFQAGSAPDTPAMKLLSKFQLNELDQMNDAQLQKVVDFLGAKDEGKTQAPLGRNWQRLRSAFNDQEIRKLLLKDTAQVVDFMLQPAQADKPGAAPKPGTQSGPRPQAGTGRRPAPDPGKGPQAGTRPGAQSRPDAGGFRQEAPRTSASAPKARPAPATPKPISIIGMDRRAALQALKARGMTDEMLREMKNEVHALVLRGNTEMAAALTQKYKSFVADEFNSDNYVHYAKLLISV